MKHFPATRFHPPLAGVSHDRAPLSRTTIALIAAVCFAAGFTAAVYTVGFILTAR
jgi:hypothetical protein